VTSPAQPGGQGRLDAGHLSQDGGLEDRRGISPPAAGPTGAARASGIDRIAAAFDGHGRRAALMPYMMGGFPDMETSLAIGEAYADVGADLVELGVPFSDPLADGPVIHAAATRALANGATLPGVLELARRLAERVPIVAMCYANPILARGVERFAHELAERGVAGLIVPDLPLEESGPVRAACDAVGVALVPLVAPTTPDERMDAIGASARGFIYVVSVTGTTGERAALASDVAGVVARARARTTVPLAVGFGIATPEQAAAAADAGADGVIVGTRLVRAASESGDPPGAVRELVQALSEALDRG
jgi:tryptophan synthase alpha chain